MKTIWTMTFILSLGVAAGLSAPAAAQSDAERAAAARAAEESVQASEAEMAAAAQAAEARLREHGAEMARAAQALQADSPAPAEPASGNPRPTVEIEVRMREAEQRLTEAARQVAELSMQRLPRVERLERIVRTDGRPLLGITIDGEDDDEPVEGVQIQGVTPGGAAAEAGLRAGDIIIAVNGEVLSAGSSDAANRKLLDFMKGVEEGDMLDVEYLRNGKTAKVELRPQGVRNAFAYRFGSDDFVIRDAPLAPNTHSFVWSSHHGGFGEMEMVRLTERLGSYFGTTDGLLVVRAPESDDYQLEDGDVLLNIDGRAPTSVSHAVRILGSYEPGETVKLEIMRDKRRRTIEVVVPDHRRSFSAPQFAPAVPGVRVAPRPKVVIVEKEKT